ncbi:lysin A, glycosyl hydrolase domain [Gordonia phage Crater]|nr:endolysin [Gordonia phage Phistory]AXQ64729.1 lysin A, glycosyl hydrolase domain [Gordonia phage Phistory]QYC53690.1 lysin A, glycosyl hydrolase domain [Gordonia phage Leroy]WNM69729.1 lysin A, glycosyl hydrolase domain [Gordonia phage Crater]
MDTATLARAMGDSLSLSRYAQLTPAFNQALAQAKCTTVNRAAMFCAQIGHESGGLRWMEEIWGPTPAQRGYEGRRDLGNTQPGDGLRFKGRGPIQMTGRHNYTEVSRWAYGNGLVPNPTFFVNDPALLSSDRYGFLGPVWYWTVARPQINEMCDRRDVHGVTRAINGGLTHIQDRIDRWNRCLKLGAALLPGDTMSYADDELKKKFPSRSKYRANDKEIDTLAGFVLNVDARIHEEFVEREALKGVDWAVALIKREAAKNDEGAKAVLAQLESKEK